MRRSTTQKFSRQCQKDRYNYSVSRWKCKDPRYYLRKIGTTDPVTATMTATCQWDRTYTINSTGLECLVHHCAHPHDHPGKHEPPLSENKLALSTPNGWDLDSWHISFEDSIKYTCPANHYFELPDPVELKPTQNLLKVKCLDSGEYEVPARLGKSWPNCTDTILCGQPPAKPSNNIINGKAEFDGYQTWLKGASNLQDTYNTHVKYSCANGSKFDNSSDGAGDTLSLTSRCQWNKEWSIMTLPSCVVTHCIQPFPLPFDTFLEELTSDWTAVDQQKEYRCQQKQGDVPTMFWESDRSKSTFSMTCLPDGTYEFDDIRENWPTCLQGRK